MDTHCEEMTTALKSKLHSGHLKDMEDLEKRTVVRNGDSKIQVQLEEDGDGGRSRQNWMEKSRLSPMFYWE